MVFPENEKRVLCARHLRKEGGAAFLIWVKTLWLGCWPDYRGCPHWGVAFDLSVSGRSPGGGGGPVSYSIRHLPAC